MEYTRNAARLLLCIAGVMFFACGDSYDRDEKIADRIELAESGDAMAQYQLGLEYNSYDQTAVKWFRKSAQQGYAPAQLKIGEAYEFGKGVPEGDVEAAAYWYEKAAHQGNARAQTRLGSLYEKGAGVDRDEAKAIDLYTKAANQQYPPAMFNLGVLHASRRDGAQNFLRAHKWFNLANRGGDYRDATSMLRAMERLLTTQEIAVAQSMATEWEKEFIASLPEDPSREDFSLTFGPRAWPGDMLTWMLLRRVEKNKGDVGDLYAVARAYLSPLQKKGHEFATNAHEAVRSYELAAQGGSAIAMMQLAWIYYDYVSTSNKTEMNTYSFAAVGIEKDRIKAYMWAHLSGRYGGDSYAGWNQALTAGMTDEDIALAKEMARDWEQEYPPTAAEPTQ